MHGVKTNARVGMHDAWIGNGAVEHRGVAIPVRLPVSAATQLFPLQPEQPMAKPPERRAVALHRMVLVVAALHASQPFTGLGQRLVDSSGSSSFNSCSFARFVCARLALETMKRPFLNPQ